MVTHAREKTSRLRKPEYENHPSEAYRGGWKVFEIPRVEPVFVGRDSQRQAMDYAKTRQGFSKGEIRVLDSAGEIVETICFDDSRKRF
jgi:hypothetical protein